MSRIPRTIRYALVPALVFVLAALGVALAPDAQAQQFCIQVITFAENPETGECEQFPTPCDVPEGWELCDFGGGVVASTDADATASARQADDFEFCAQVITFAENPETGECEAFPTPCDVPEGWELCDPFTIG